MFLGGWALMTGVGMLPGVAPATRLVVATRGALEGARFVAAYSGVWLALGVIGYLALSPLAPAVGAAGTGVALAATGAYELTPFKSACLRRCRSPLRILLQPSFFGGVRHGLDCAGCCALLMGMMLALGLMSVLWAIVLAAVVLVQKAAPLGQRSPAVLAAGLGLAAVVAWL